jgi:hypothetical protein
MRMAFVVNVSAVESSAVTGTRHFSHSGTAEGDVAKKVSGDAKPSVADGSAAVERFFDTLDHPHVEALRELRRVILTADPSISEGIKWNVPSFQTTGHFATMHLRAKRGVAIILHFGAGKRADLPARSAIVDPGALLEWLADDRAIVVFDGLAGVKARSAAFTMVIRQWIRYV